MKIALAQLNLRIGDFDRNVNAICRHIEKARQQEADLVIFSELSVCAYPPADFLEFPDFLERCEQALQFIAAQSTNIAVIVGCPTINSSGKGKPLYNSAVIIQNGIITHRIHKTLLPNYDIFDEYRYFEPNRIFEVITIKEQRFALTICEDLWNLSDTPLYVDNPMEQLIPQKPDLIINIAASPFDYTQKEKRKKILARNAQNYGLPLIYVNQTGAHTELIFDGGSMVLDALGNTLAELEYFKEDFLVINTTALPAPVEKPANSKIQLIHDALVLGIRDYFEKLGMKKAILGLSGGIDSAIVAALAAEALGSENLLCLLLPSRYSSDHSVEDALKLVHNLSCKHEIISIEDSYIANLKTLEPWFAHLPFSLAEENIQARLRALILMAFSNKFGYILLNTSNKSEAAVGYGTLYGDMCGGLSVIGDVYKTQVYELAAYINRSKEIIPLNTITKPPSAELRPGQKDSDSLPDYASLDKVLMNYIEERKGPLELQGMGIEKPVIDRILHLVNSNEYKRHQCPPILRVSPKAFGKGRRMPIAASYLAL